MPEAVTVTEPVRVEPAAADLHHRAVQALRRERAGADLPGHRRRVVEGIVEAVRHDVQAGIRRTRIGRTERVELLDRAVGIDHDQRARQQPESLHRARLAKHELDQLAEQANSRLLPGRGVPALEDGDQPVAVAGARRSGAPVRVRQQQVKRGGTELQQRLIGAQRMVLHVDRAEDPAVAVTELRRPQQVKPGGDRGEAVAAVRVEPVPAGRFGVSVQADADPDPQALERGQHRTVEESAVGLQGDVHHGGHAGAERADQAGQPLLPGEQRLAAVQDDVDGAKAVPGRMLGDPLDGLIGYRLAHPPGQAPPSLIRHFIHIAIRARQIATTMNLQDELLEWHRLMSGRPDHRHVEIEKRPPRRLLGFMRRRHVNQAAKSSGSAWTPWPARHRCTSNSSGRRSANSGRDGAAGSRWTASASPIQAAGSGSAASWSR